MVFQFNWTNLIFGPHGQAIWIWSWLTLVIGLIWHPIPRWHLFLAVLQTPTVSETAFAHFLPPQQAYVKKKKRVKNRVIANECIESESYCYTSKVDVNDISLIWLLLEFYLWQKILDYCSVSSVIWVGYNWYLFYVEKFH